MGLPVYSFSRQAPSSGDGRGGDQTISDAFGSGTARGGVDTKSSFMKCNLNLSDLPPALGKRFQEVVADQYKGDMQAALAAFWDLHDKHGRSKA